MTEAQSQAPGPEKARSPVATTHKRVAAASQRFLAALRSAMRPMTGIRTMERAFPTATAVLQPKAAQSAPPQMTDTK